MSPNDRRERFMLSATVDFPDDTRTGIYTPELLDEMMVQLKSMGVRRIYWLYYGDVDPDSYWAGSILRMAYGPQTLERIGEPLKAAVPVAHKHGMEIFGVLKPYDVGLSGTYPKGGSVRCSAGTLEPTMVLGSALDSLSNLGMTTHSGRVLDGVCFYFFWNQGQHSVTSRVGFSSRFEQRFRGGSVKYSAGTLGPTKVLGSALDSSSNLGMTTQPGRSGQPGLLTQSGMFLSS